MILISCFGIESSIMNDDLNFKNFEVGFDVLVLLGMDEVDI